MRRDRVRLAAVVIPGFVLMLGAMAGALGGDATVTGTASASARSSTWVDVDAAFTGDDDGDGYTIFEIGPTGAGPFSAAGAFWPMIPGSAEWRANVFEVAPGGTYFFRVTFVDPDGVTGANPQVVGPIVTPAAAPNGVTVDAATAVVNEDEIYVSVPISDDANRNSGGTVDVATSASGPWTRRCGNPFEANLPFHPKRCRIRSLTPGTDYWVRVTITDSDGVVASSNPQILGPIHYDGLPNLALGRPITADPGWGCCPSPSHFVDGRIQNDAWYYGFAWTGGNSCWAGGCPPGYKQATIDLGVPTDFNRAVMWYHDPSSVPTDWKFQYSNDGAVWTDAHVNLGDPICRTAGDAMPGAWYYPACGHQATFSTVNARYFRYTFDDRTLFGGLHGWAVELEVYNAPTNQAPVAQAMDVTVEAGPGCTANASVDNGSYDPDGDPITITQSPPGPYPLGATSVTLTVTDSHGATSEATATVTVVDTTPPDSTDPVAAPSSLWPPNHKMVDVTVTYDASDHCGTSCSVVSVTSNEPVDGTGDGDTAPDWEIVDAQHVRLRAERSGTGAGRVYTITVECVDGSGNATAKSTTVVVPHDQRK